MWFHCNILDVDVNCFVIRIFHLALLTIQYYDKHLGFAQLHFQNDYLK
jgi:hypothetical protein